VKNITYKAIEQLVQLKLKSRVELDFVMKFGERRNFCASVPDEEIYFQSFLV